MKLKGEMVIELTDTNTGAVETVQETNMITEAVNNILGLNPMGIYLKASGEYDNSVLWNGTLLPICPNMIGGILLFPAVLEEKADHIYEQGKNLPVAYASNNVNSGSDVARGSLNQTESKKLDNGYKFVWEFTPSQGNGNIAAVALTSALGGQNAFGSAAGDASTFLLLKKVDIGDIPKARQMTLFEAVELDFEKNLLYSITFGTSSVTITKIRIPVFNIGLNEKLDDTTYTVLEEQTLTTESFTFLGDYTKYVDANGKTQCLYSWRLVKTDTVPEGKRDNGALRDIEKRVQRDVDDDIIPDGDGYTVLKLVEKYISQKTGVKNTTRAGYGTVINVLKAEPFGNKRIDKVKLSDAKAWLIKLQQEDHKSFSTIHTIRGVVRPAFQMAVDDDLIRKNPFEFQMATVLVNDAVTREAITRKEERTFLEFIKNDTHYSKYYDGMYILFKTGMRISEFTGLTLSDLDFENRTINIDHQLQKTGTLVYIDTTKTYAGRRVIPMTDDVYEAFQNIVKARPKLKVEPMIDGYSGFLCFDKDNKPMVAMHWEKYFQHAVDRYNSIYRVQLPKITPHGRVIIRTS